jgi:colicin import membrane protein
VPKADIVFKDKKKKKVTSVAPVKKETPVVKSSPKPDENTQQQAIEKQRDLDQTKQAKQQELDKQLAEAAQAAREAERIQERRAKMRAEADEATKNEVAKYKELIQAKISRNIIMPPDVADKAEAIFLVTVLPGGSVMDNVKLEKSSGNAAYDSAAERAIYKAQPLPVPQDPELARMFRELRLSVKP